MTDNERINKWWMEQRGFKLGPAPDRYSCGCETAWLKEGDASCPQCMSIDFSSPHSDAWTPELYQKIEDAGMVAKFIPKLTTIIDANDPIIKEGRAGKAKRLLYGLFAFVKATPAQKARALAATINEKGG